MKNTLSDLNNYLFEELERINDDGHKRKILRGVPEEMLQNIRAKIGYYEAAVEALKG